MNNVCLIGRLTADPDLRHTTSQKAVVSFSLAVDRPYSKEKQADFIRIYAFGTIAENVANYLSKGRQAAVSGRIVTGSYEKNGRTIYTTDIHADRVEFIGSAESTEKQTRTQQKKQIHAKEADIPAGFHAFDDSDDDIPF